MSGGSQTKALQSRVIDDSHCLDEQGQTDDLITVMGITLRVIQSEHQAVGDREQGKNNWKKPAGCIDNKQEVEDRRDIAIISADRIATSDQRSAPDPQDGVDRGKAPAKTESRRSQSPKSKRKKNPSSELTAGKEKNPAAKFRREGIALFRKKDTLLLLDLSILKANLHQVQLQLFGNVFNSLGGLFS